MTTEQELPGISVIICAHNAADTIVPTLDALGKCRLPAECEVILVDNNSTDGTAEIAEERWANLNRVEFPLRIIEEKKPGVVFARKAGARAATYSVIVFCDDDNWLEPDYLERAWEIMQDSSVGAVGGSGLPAKPDLLPPLFYSFSWGYAVGSQVTDVDKLAGSADSGLYPISNLWGAGMVVRRKALLEVFSLEGFPVLVGRKGAELTSGEDNEISFCLTMLGYRLFYSGKLRYRHDLGEERLTVEYIRDLISKIVQNFRAYKQYGQVRLALEKPVRGLFFGAGRIAKHLFTGSLQRSSFTMFLAAARLRRFLSPWERRLYDNVNMLRKRARL